MQKSEMFVRMGLRSGALPFGVAIHASSKRVGLIISAPQSLQSTWGLPLLTWKQKYGGMNEQEEEKMRCVR